jgi:hypothetical protein
MPRNARIRYRVARGAGHSFLHSLGFALFNLRSPVVQKGDRRPESRAAPGAQKEMG